MSNLESCLIFEIFSNKYDGSLPKYFKIIELLISLLIIKINKKTHFRTRPGSNKKGYSDG